MVYQLSGMNIEVTTKCPLRCPQCYCSLCGGKNIDKTRAIQILKQAKELGLEHVEFSGGETLCYPYLTNLISFASRLSIETSISLSGWSFDAETLQHLVEAGISTIYVSLNGPTKEINQETRDGFEYAIHALGILHNYNFPNVILNWVMHRNNADTLPDMIDIGKRFGVEAILIIEPQPTYEGNLDTYPTKDQLFKVADMVKHHNEEPQLWIHHCFSPLLALSCENIFWGNSNRGIYKGCSAGLASISVDVDGNFIPCRHLPIPEEYENVQEYWQFSPVLSQIRVLAEQKRSEPCSQCTLNRYCRPCLGHNRQETNNLISEPLRCLIGEALKDIK